MIKSNVRVHSIFRPILAAITSLFAAGAVVQPAAAVVISQTTQQMPSLATFNGKLYLAWAGTDSAHHLNVAASTNGTTFGAPSVSSNWAASDTGPAITAFNGKLYIVWAGGGNNLNIASSSDGVNFGNQSFVSTLTSTCTPALAASATTLYLAYCINLENVLVTSSTDGTTWTTPVSPPGDASHYSPAIAVFGNEVVFAFTTPPNINGAGATVVYSAPATSPLPISTGWTYNTALGSSSGTCCGSAGLAPLNSSLYMGLFNSAEVPFVYNFETSSNGLLAVVSDQTIPGTVNSATNPALAVFNGHLYFAFKGTDNPAHLNIVEVF
jgi:hypothetical protein